MERVLKRVGLSKRCSDGKSTVQKSQSADQPQVQPQAQAPSTTASDKDEHGDKIRRRRRSKSRRRFPQPQDGKKSRGLFNIDWESVRDCKSCKSRAITRKLCSKRCDNELYRSNSFKFERFVRGSDEISTLSKKISLCDDYSLPVDHVNKRRPNSFAAPSLSEWNVCSPNEDQIEVLETYSNPKDSKTQINQNEEGDSKYYTSPDREYSQPYTTDGSSEPTSDEEFFGHVSVAKPIELNSPDSITEAILPLVNLQSPERVDVKRHPSPYYYADLYKGKGEESIPVPSRGSRSVLGLEGDIPSSSISIYKYRKSCSLDEPDRDRDRDEDHFISRKKLGGSTYRHKNNSSIESQSTESQSQQSNIKDVLNHNEQECLCLPMPPNRLVSPCSCLIPLPQDGVDEDDMTRQRHVYETAFDCRISKSDDDLDQIDKVSNHPVLVQLNSRPSTSQQHHIDISTVCTNLQEMHVSPKPNQMLVYTPSPPSSAPLPAKFHGKDISLNNISIRSSPSLPSTNASASASASTNTTNSTTTSHQLRLKDVRLPVKSLRAKMSPQPSPSASSQPSRLLKHIGPDHNQQQILEIKDRPRKDCMRLKRHKDHISRDSILEYKSCRRRHKYSSTESMTTSSSGGSMESLRSSTSEGNRSTTSSESRHSTSLSSHSSDSGGIGYLGHLTQTSSFLVHSNKLHILSPISDKSSQEPVSETSDNNKNNNSQKCSPEDVISPSPEIALTGTSIKTKRRMPQNKNLLSLAEIQGSDSGISIQSRDGVKSRFGFTSEINATHQDLSELPFDMPKLRRRRLGLNEGSDACTSGSTTSVDLRDLPFDMPKLRRRLRVPQSSTESSVSQASSSQSVVEVQDKQMFRPKLTLNLGESASCPRPLLNLNIGGCVGASTSAPIDLNLIDISLPLERQGWYHGAITRVEAECVLRLLREGSFLVRNSESTRQDYSLSLKSARGFMHMRIQRNGVDGTFILGQFSKPFHSIPEMIRHFSLNRLPVRGAEHMCLLQPVIAQLL